MMRWDVGGCGKGLRIQNLGNRVISSAGGSLTSSDWCGLLLSGRSPAGLGANHSSMVARSLEGSWGPHWPAMPHTGDFI